MAILTYEQFLEEIEFLSQKTSKYDFTIKSEGGGFRFLSFKNEIRYTPILKSNDFNNSDNDLSEDVNSVVSFDHDQVIKCEFNVTYSLSYSVPLLLVRFIQHSGALLPFDEVRDLLKLGDKNLREDIFKPCLDYTYTTSAPRSFTLLLQITKSIILNYFKLLLNKEKNIMTLNILVKKNLNRLLIKTKQSKTWHWNISMFNN